LVNEYLVINPTNGLGNRVRSLASFAVLADELKLPLFVHWSKSSGFDDTSISELFKTDDINFIDTHTWNDIKSKSFSISDHIEGVCENYIDSVYKDKRVHYINKVLTGGFKQMTATSSNLLSWAFGIYEVDKHIKNFSGKYKTQLSKLKPSDKVINAAQSTLDTFSKNIIGVHIRQGDATSHKNQWSKMYSDKTLIAINDHFDKTNTQIFLCTDDQKTLNQMLNRYGNRIIHYTKTFVDSLYGETKKGQFDAMVELYLLSQTNKILATSPSSFAKLAADWSNKNYFSTQPIILATGNPKKMIQILQS
jgi:hypothetical protein